MLEIIDAAHSSRAAMLLLAVMLMLSAPTMPCFQESEFPLPVANAWLGRAQGCLSLWHMSKHNGCGTSIDHVSLNTKYEI